MSASTAARPACPKLARGLAREVYYRTKARAQPAASAGQRVFPLAIEQFQSGKRLGPRQIARIQRSIKTVFAGLPGPLTGTCGKNLAGGIDADLRFLAIERCMLDGEEVASDRLSHTGYLLRGVRTSLDRRSARQDAWTAPALVANHAVERVFARAAASDTEAAIAMIARACVLAGLYWRAHRLDGVAAPGDIVVPTEGGAFLGGLVRRHASYRGAFDTESRIAGRVGLQIGEDTPENIVMLRTWVRDDSMLPQRRAAVARLRAALTAIDGRLQATAGEWCHTMLEDSDHAAHADARFLIEQVHRTGVAQAFDHWNGRPERIGKQPVLQALAA